MNFKFIDPNIDKCISIFGGPNNSINLELDEKSVKEEIELHYLEFYEYLIKKKEK